MLSKSPFQEEDSVCFGPDTPSILASSLVDFCFSWQAFNEFTKMAVFFHFISFRIDLCVPSTCSKDDIQRVANLSEYS